MKKYNIAIVGATGVVGRETIKILEERDFPVGNLKLLASRNSIGKVLNFHGREIEVEELSRKSFENIDLAFFSAGGNISKKYVPKAVEAGAVAIDKSSVFRMDNHVPLVVPEVNPRDVFKHQGIIANPNCSTIQLVVALKPIYDLVGIKRLIISTYQSVSGSGKLAVQELEQQSAEYLKKEKMTRKVYPHQIAFNVLPHIDVFEDNEFTREEMKMIHETKKILNDDTLKITATTARVPVFIGHAESVYLETEKKIDINKLKLTYLKSEGIKLVDDTENAKYPLPIMSEVYDDVMVGRIRKDLAVENGINLWIAANNLRKGAALNAVQIAELLIK
ncbi:MAG: aspartate-semialdehyde dehydrogenase [Candidatus Cloacimonetes bacterium]|nr:aspartate-semialdehyde dehydrogenase [Candidatus Cloacimonadota bacterium]MCF7814213.1 aspartate-semialdehyde dehydrogenase [Candidatus Cloacimonadota bacterium]MCF7868128.1 aspartate-semialdehyde dehydrogenase [Candidatus Cloacimonadota bacterium]MCF7883594.1 aspartate-semialdehyde dehydrogenase [Candidatus Cloacimonadota bacterium]